jgi:hypothetical protein
MAHYARLDENNYVIGVHKLDDFFELNDFGELDEKRAEKKLKEIHGDDTKWKKTSYNDNIRRRYASVGGQYDQISDAFIDPKPYPSWVLNNETLIWEAPKPKPPTIGGQHWDWNEEQQEWEEEVQ